MRELVEKSSRYVLQLIGIKIFQYKELTRRSLVSLDTHSESLHDKVCFYKNGEFYAWRADRYENSTREGVEKKEKILFPSGLGREGKEFFLSFLLPSE